MALEPILSATRLSLSFGRNLILDDATLAVNAGEKIGLVGRNGCGKSSFLRILAGQEDPEGGHISRKQGLTTGYLPQEFELEESATVEENIRRGAGDLLEKIRQFESSENLSVAQHEKLQGEIDHADGWNLETRMETLMRELSTPPAGRVVQSLSGGEKRRVGLARALISQPDLLILDEPTNHLDAGAIEWMEEYLATLPGACLFVTHDRYFLERISTRIVELSDGHFFSHEGKFSDYLLARAERMEREQAVEHRRQRFLAREIEWVRSGVKARGAKQRSRLDRFYAVKSQKAPEEELNMDLIIPTAPRMGNVVANLKAVSVSREGRALFLGLDLAFSAGECVGIVGPNGAGKTTLLRTVMGEIEPDHGVVRIGKRTKFNYADQSRLVLDENASVYENVAQGKESMKFGEDTISVRAYLKRFLFSDDRIKGRVGLLSGGEKNRVLLARILKNGGNFIILDEPTNDLDLQTLRVLEEALIHFSGTSLVVSHDRWFLDRVCDRVIVFEGGGRITVSAGNYSYYREKRREPKPPLRSSGGKKPKRSAPARSEVMPPPRLKWKEQRELEGMEEAILRAEETVLDLETILNDPVFYVENSERAVAMTAELEERKEAVAQLYKRWSELEGIREKRARWEAD